MLYRLFLFAINIFFPPLSVLLVTGPYTDTLVNCLLFLCGVIPSHIHGFYVNCTYFHRRRKVKKGRWPGGPKAFIFDRNVWYGGLSKEEADALRGSGDAKRRSRGKNRRRRSQAEVKGSDDCRKDPRGNSQTLHLDQYPYHHHVQHGSPSSAGRFDGDNHVSSTVTPNRTNSINQTSAAGPAAGRMSTTTGAAWARDARHKGHKPPPVSAHAAQPLAANPGPERRTIVGEIWRL